MLYAPPKPWSQEGSGHLKYSVAKTAVIRLDGLAFLVQQQVKDFKYPYYYTVIRGIVTAPNPVPDCNGGGTLYELAPADPKYKADLEGLLREHNFKGHLEFSRFLS